MTTTRLTDTVTVITGASTGIGAATARAAATAGSHVVIVGRSLDKLTELADDISDNGGRALPVEADVTDPEAVEQLVQRVVQELGTIDHLVNNAGLMLFSKWSDGALDDWNAMIDTNIRGYLHGIHAVLPTMLANSHGHIVNMSSVAGIRVGDSSGVYSATKFFIRGITDSLRQEVGVDHGIRVSMISPGVINTGWADKVTNEKGRATAKTLNEGAIEPEAIADAVVFALSQPAGVVVNDLVVHPVSQRW